MVEGANNKVIKHGMHSLLSFNDLFVAGICYSKIHAIYDLGIWLGPLRAFLLGQDTILCKTWSGEVDFSTRRKIIQIFFLTIARQCLDTHLLLVGTPPCNLPPIVQYVSIFATAINSKRWRKYDTWTILALSFPFTYRTSTTTWHTSYTDRLHPMVEYLEAAAWLAGNDTSLSRSQSLFLSTDDPNIIDDIARGRYDHMNFTFYFTR